VNLFELAHEKDEYNFALSLAPEFKGYQLTSAMDAQMAYHEYRDFLELKQFNPSPIRVRVALALYCHVAEAAGLWCIPMCMLGILEGREYSTDPFHKLVELHKVSGQRVAPNANRIFGTMAGAAKSLGLQQLSEVFRDAFDSDLRNGFAHADYALNHEGVHVRGRHDRARIIGWREFQRLFDNGVDLYQVLLETVEYFQREYETPKVVPGRCNAHTLEDLWLVYLDPVSKVMSVSGGPGWTKEALLEQHRAQHGEHL